MAIVPEGGDGANITQDTARLAVLNAEPRYIEGVLSAGSSQHWMFQRTKGAAVRGINLGDLKKFPVPLAPVAEQQKFAEVSEKILLMLSAARRHLIEAEQMVASLQHRAFSGQL